MFIDDILVFSRNAEDHERHVRAVMDAIRKAGFHLHGSKCLFGRTSAPFLGFDIGGEDPDGASIHMAYEKVKAISDWSHPASPEGLRSFVGLSGVYRKFVPNFTKISAPLMELISVDQREFDACKADAARWARVVKAADFLKAAMVACPALALPQKGNYNYVVRTDASDFAIGATLRQLQFPDSAGSELVENYCILLPQTARYRNQVQHPRQGAARYPRRHRTLEILPEERPQVRVQTDHSALQHILSLPKLTGRQMRLLETLQEYDFDVEYYPGARNYIEDALSRRPDYKKSPIPRIPAASAIPTPPPQPQPAELLPILASRVQADEWLDRLRPRMPVLCRCTDCAGGPGSARGRL